jgi:hypothetical protein
MCNCFGKLIPWLDHELSVQEAADVKRHVRVCAECRSNLDRYKQVTGAFEAYCEAAMALKMHRRMPRWAPVLIGAVAAVAALLLAIPRDRVAQPPVHSSVIAATRAVVVETAPAAIKRTHRRHVVRPVRSRDTDLLPADLAIAIAIPAEAMFAPGAVPEGVNFIAELSIAADGSAKGIRLQP